MLYGRISIGQKREIGSKGVLGCQLLQFGFRRKLSPEIMNTVDRTRCAAVGKARSDHVECPRYGGLRGCRNEGTVKSIGFVPEDSIVLEARIVFCRYPCSLDVDDLEMVL
jgi:hypothetical protein